MDFLPLGLKLAGHIVVVVGGGDTALRKARLLHRAGARLRLVAPQWRAELQALVEREGAGGECHRRAFQDDDLEGARLVVLATDDGALNERVAALCAARGVPVNVVDRPDISSFVFPALIDRDPLFITISSSGVSPVLTRRLRARLEAWLPSRWGRLAGILGRFRAPLARALPDRKAREAFWERQLDGPLVEQVLSGHESEAEAALHAAVAHADQERPPPVDGEVYLVGAGPGDPDLLTFRGLHLLRKADTVLYDRLVAPEILALAREDAELIYVGKARDRHTLPQDNINDLLVHYAREGKKV
ncbi:MAG TPA: siroheme synthase, partial [Alcanivorax sp.]|nr:siroheme synthase [Alcanivorax sp.]